MNTNEQHRQVCLDTLEKQRQQPEPLREQSEQRYNRAARHLKIQAGLAFLVIVVAMLLSPINRTAQAQTAPTEAQQNAAIASLQSAVAALQNTVNSQQTTLNSLSAKVTAQQTAITALQTGLNTQQNTITTLQGALTRETARAQQAEAALVNRATALETRTQFMSANAAAHATVFSGCNLFLNNGLGATNGLPGNPLSTDPTLTRTNGLGNLIVGYNESAALSGGTDIRTGSHNIIVGQLQNYSSYGGLVAGIWNASSAPYASVSGGYNNEASSFAASVSGGEANLASGDRSSISGGYWNTASGYIASLSGGHDNAAGGNWSSISGGSYGAADGDTTSVSGGQSNTARGFNASVSGGHGNVASGLLASVSGGINNTQQNNGGWSGGAFHTP
jgi:hypothetical protein